MIKIIIQLALDTFAVLVGDYLIEGIFIANVWTALVVAVVLGVLNRLVKPLILLFTLPINLLTLGLFTFVVNGIIVLLAALIVPSFYIETFLAAILFSVVLSIVSFFLNLLK